MTTRPLFALLVAMGALLIAPRAFAESSEEEGHTVVILTSRNDAVMARLRGEVSSIGLHASVVVSDGKCVDATITREMVAQTATSLLCVDDRGISIWGLGNSVAVLKEQLEWTALPPSALDPVLVQATETVRGNEFVSRTEASDRAFISALGPEIELLRLKPEPSPRATLHAGLGFVSALGTNHIGSEAAASFGAEVRMHRWLSVLVNAAVPLSTYSDVEPESLVDTRTGELRVSALIPFTPETSWLIPKLGIGAGLLALYTEPSASVLTGRSQLLVSPMFGATSSLSLRIADPVRLAWSVDVGMTTANMVVRVDGNDGAFGWPYLASDLALEVQLR